MTTTILIGDSGSGKTTLIERLVTDTFDPLTNATIGVDYQVFRDAHNNAIKVWDTAGAERFRSIMSLYYRSAKFCILVFDASRTLGLRSAAVWAAEVRKHASDCRIFLVGNKIDRGQRACDMPGVVELAKELGFVGVAFVSAKHMCSAEIIRMIQPLFNVEEGVVIDFDDDSHIQPLLGGLGLETQQTRSGCCWS